jgi:uncharacterized membrane protein
MSQSTDPGAAWEAPEEQPPPPAPAPPAPTPARRFDDQAWGALARSLLVFALMGASIAHFCNLVRASWLVDLIQTNTLRARVLFNQWAAVGAALGVAAGVWLRLARPRSEGLARLRATACWLAPFTLIGLLPGLFATRGWPNTVQLALALGAIVLGFEPLVRIHLAADRRALPGARLRGAVVGWLARIPPAPAFLRRHGTFLFVVSCAVGYALYASFYTIRNHWHFNTFDYDLGQYDNLIYNALHGRPMRCTPLIREGNWTELKNHADFSIYALLPFYALVPRAETLLVLQSTMLGLGAIPLYRFAARRVEPWVAACLAVAYLLFAPLHTANFFDFHMQPIAAGTLLWMIDMFDQRRYKTVAVLILIALGCREDVSIGLTAFGLFVILTGQRVRAGAVIVAVAATYFVIMRFVVMPSFGQWGFEGFYRELFPANDNSFRGVIATMVSNPLWVFKTMMTEDKLRYALQIMVPIAFLPLRRAYLWLAVAPGSLFTVLTTLYPPTTQISYQYSCHFVPYIFTASALALAAYGNSEEGRRRRKAAVMAALLGTALVTTHWGAIPPRLAFRAGYGNVRFERVSEAEKLKRKYLHELEALVPRQATFAVSDAELPHLSNRLNCWALIDGYANVDYILWLTPANGSRDAIQATAALQSGQYEEIATRPGLSLLKRKGAAGPIGAPARPSPAPAKK